MGGCRLGLELPLILVLIYEGVHDSAMGRPLAVRQEEDSKSITDIEVIQQNLRSDGGP
jgi:hypothetical protein